MQNKTQPTTHQDFKFDLKNLNLRCADPPLGVAPFIAPETAEIPQRKGMAFATKPKLREGEPYVFAHRKVWGGDLEGHFKQQHFS